MFCNIFSNAMAMNDYIDKNTILIERKNSISPNSSAFNDNYSNVIDELNPCNIKNMSLDEQLEKAFEYLSIANSSDYDESAFYYVAAKWLDPKNQSVNAYLQYVGFNDDLDRIRLNDSELWNSKKDYLIKSAKYLSELMRAKFE